MKTSSTQNLFEHDLFPQIELDTLYHEGKRYYKTPDGKLYPSVTSVLSFFKDDAIDQWRAKVGEQEANRVSKYATDRGTALHTLCENYLNNMDNFKRSVMPSTLSLFKGIQPIIDRDVEVVHGIEIPLFSHTLKTAGRCDLFCRYQGVYTIADFKTSTRSKKPEWIENYFLQATAYAIMIEEMYKEYERIHIPQLAIIIAVEDDEVSHQLFVKQTAPYREKVKEMFDNYHAQHQLLTIDQIEG